MKQTTTMFYKNVGAWLKTQRLLKKQTQTEIAEIIGVTFQQIQKYEKAKNKINLDFFVKLCDYFKVDTGLVISNCRDNLYLPDELVNQGYITVSTQEVSKEPNLNLSAKYWIDKKGGE